MQSVPTQEKLRSIYIGFSRPKKSKLLSSLIMRVEKTNYSHVFLKFYAAKYDRWLVYEASGIDVKFKSVSRFQISNMVVDCYRIDLEENHYNRTIAWCIDNCATPYGIIQLFGMFYVYLFECIFKKRVRNPLRDGKKSQVCSEMIGYMLKENKIMDIDGDLDLAGPKIIHNIVDKYVNCK